MELASKASESSEVSALFTLLAILQQLPGAYLRAVLSKRIRGEGGEGSEALAEPEQKGLPVFQEMAGD